MAGRRGTLSQIDLKRPKGRGVTASCKSESLALRPFQRRFLSGFERPDIQTGVLSLPRGNGKSTLTAYILERCLTPGDPLFEAGAEYLLGAASLEQARNSFRPLRDALEPTGSYRFIDSITRLGITHKPTNTKLRVMSSNAKTAFGIVGTPLAVLDEPGAWEVRGGELMYDALSTAQGKPGSRLRLLFVGTLAPATSGWWHDLVARGSHGSTFVAALQGDAATWDKWPTIRKANPLTAISADFRAKLLEERDEARRDPRLAARFKSYRLNRPSPDAATMLLTVEDWQRLAKRPVPPADGRPCVGIDLGGGVAWSAAVALYANGRVEAMAVAPGIPSLAEQERRDRVPTGTYERLLKTGRLTVAAGRRVQPVEALIESILNAWGRPRVIVCDRFRLDAMKDVTPRVRIEPRVSRWSEASNDIRSLRRMALDGPLSIESSSRRLLKVSLAAARVQSDDAGNSRLIKRDRGNVSRDDVAQALVLGAGALDRQPKRIRRAYRGAA